MKRRDLLVVLGLFAVLVVALVIAAPYARQEAEDGLPALSTHSAAPRGGLALYLWLAHMGYDVRNLEYETYALSEETGLLFLLNPTVAFDEQRADTVERWVRQGGTLVLSVESFSPALQGIPVPRSEADAVFKRLGASVRVAERFLEVAEPSQPVLHRPPLRKVLAKTFGEVVLTNPAGAVYLSADGRPVVVGLPLGEGKVYVVGATYPFSNEGLAREDNWRLVLNLIADVKPGSRVLFDEYHHGFVTGRSLGTLVLTERWGWALIYGAAVALAWTALNGRRFGRAVPLAGGAYRSAGEYVHSLAAMLRRTGARGWLLIHTHDQMKIDLGRAYGLPTSLPDDRFAEEIGRRAGREVAPLRSALAALQESEPRREDRVLALVRRAEAVRRDLIERGDVR